MDKLFQQLETPPKEYRPFVRWWWTGLNVEKGELVREIDDLDRGGFGGAEIQAFMIGSPTEKSQNYAQVADQYHRYMQPYYYEMLETVLTAAEEKNITIDITQNSAWPTGGTHITPELSHKTLLGFTKLVQGGRHYAGPVPQCKKPIIYFITEKVIPMLMGGLKIMIYDPADKKLVRVVAGRCEGKQGKFRYRAIKKPYLLDFDSMQDITDKVDVKGHLEWDVPAGTIWELFAFYEGTAGAKPLMDARSDATSPTLVVDHLSSKGIAYHMDRHFDPAWEKFEKHFGKTFRAFFTDSLELITPWHWADHFLETFKQRRGYDLTSYLPAAYIPLRDVAYYMYGNNMPGPNFGFKNPLIGERIRYDFSKTVSELFVDEFCHTLGCWAEKKGVQSRMQAYGIAADTLAAWGRGHIPETEQLYAGGTLDFLRFAASAAALYHKPVVTAETMVWPGRDYMTTPSKWKIAVDRLLVSGINQCIYHGFPYKNPDWKWPGFHAFSSHYMPQMSFSDDFSRENAFFRYFPQINGYVARGQLLMRQAPVVYDVGIFYGWFDYTNAMLHQEEGVGGYFGDWDASLSVPSGLLGGLMGKPINENKMDPQRKWTKKLQELGTQLVNNGYGYCHVNEESLLASRIEEGKLVMGTARLSCLILLQQQAISVVMANKLKEIDLAGIPVLLIDQLPTRQPGFENYIENDAIVTAACADIMKSRGVQVAGLDEALRQVSAWTPSQVVYEKPQSDIQFIHRAGETAEVWFFRSSSQQPVTFSFGLRGQARQAVLINLWTGEAQRIKLERKEDGLYGQAGLPSYGSLAMLLTDEDVSSLPVGELPQLTVRQKKQELTKWSLVTKIREIDGTMQPVTMELEGLRDWAKDENLKDCSSEGFYRTTFDWTAEGTIIGQRFILSLGRVGDVAEVTLNGQKFPALLIMPWEVDITAYLKEGNNDLEILVVPTLRNVLVGYGQKSPSYKQFKKKTIRMPSGLLGPVMILVE